DELETAARLGLLATIAAGLAHDLGNPLTALVLQLQGLGRDMFVAERAVRAGADGPDSPFDACRASLVALEETADFIRRMVRDFVLLGGGRGPRAGATLVRGAVDCAVRLTRSLVSERATIELSVPADLCVAVDDDSLIRALTPLTLTAAAACPPDAALANRIVVVARAAWAGVTIDVTDTGGGVPEPVRHRLFKPFTTSKRGGQGLGLAVARSLLRRARGDLDLVATRPHGTTFPCPPPALPARPPDRPLRPRPP